MRIILLVASLAVAQFVFAGNGVMTIPDVRVAPILQTHWGQLTDTGYVNKGNPCFNLYTPGNAPCGCSATALAQVISYFKYPSNAPDGVYDCAIDGVAQALSILPGAYAWDLMTPDTRAGVSLAEREAIGKLTYDCAVAFHTDFGQEGSLAYSDSAFSILTGAFGYRNAMGYCPAGGASFEDIKAAMFASLDIGWPVMASLLTADGVGHQVLIDGYGFSGNTPYVHILFGWPAKSDACDCWYVLPDVRPTDEYAFTSVDGIVYNINPVSQVDVLSGRVLDETGSPVSNVVVSVTYNEGGKAKAMMYVTKGNGIYAFMLPGGKEYQISCGQVSKSVYLPKSVSAACSWKNPLMPAFTSAGECGNSWGNDFVISSEPVVEDLLGAFMPTTAVSGKYPYCGAVYDSDGTAFGTMTVNVGRPSKKNVSKVSATVSLLDGKKYSAKSTDFAVNASGSASVGGIEVKKLGNMDLSVGNNGFLAKITTSDGSVLTASTADLSKGIPAGFATFSVAGLPEKIGDSPVLDGCSPDGQLISISAKGKWDCGKAASVKYKKVTVKDPETGKKTSHYVLEGMDDTAKPNRSGLKLTYTAKSAQFKGSFYVYSNTGTEDKPKLKKTTVSVSGFVIDGKGIGTATIKNVGSYPVSIQ